MLPFFHNTKRCNFQFSVVSQFYGTKVHGIPWLASCMVSFSWFHGSLVVWYHFHAFMVPWLHGTIFMLSWFLGCMVPFSFVSSLESLAKSSKPIKIGLVKIFPANQTKIIKYLVLGIWYQSIWISSSNCLSVKQLVPELSETAGAERNSWCWAKQLVPEPSQIAGAGAEPKG